MSEKATNVTTGFLLTGCAILALLIVIPAASAAANRIKPGWRAWVWPLVFLSLAASTLLETIGILRGDPRSGVLGQLNVLLLGLTLHWIILNSFYRALGDRPARTIAPFVWLGYALFVVAQLISGQYLSVLIYEILCAAVLAVVYFPLFVKDRDLSADSQPILIGLVLSVLAALVRGIEFSADLVLLVLTNTAVFHLVQGIGVIFFMIGGNSSYNVKYAAQRRRERETINEVNNYNS
jgi:hypothetical protein